MSVHDCKHLSVNSIFHQNLFVQSMALWVITDITKALFLPNFSNGTLQICVTATPLSKKISWSQRLSLTVNKNGSALQTINEWFADKHILWQTVMWEIKEYISDIKKKLQLFNIIFSKLTFLKYCNCNVALELVGTYSRCSNGQMTIMQYVFEFDY